MKIGRNEKCICGSGRKFKKCCLHKSQMPQTYSDKVSDFVTNKLMKLPQEVFDKKNKEHLDAIDREYKEFVSLFNVGTCYLCKQELSSMSKNIRCFHWLLNLDRFKKSDFENLIPIIEKKGVFRLQSFLRWVANLKGLGKNISDSPTSESEVLNATIGYDGFEVAFSAGANDHKGHKGSNYEFPHYHIQIRNSLGTIVKFNDFHIRFSEEDLFNLEMIKNHSSVFKHTWGFGESTYGLLKNDPIFMIDHATPTTDYENATMNFQSIVTAEPGTLISGDDLADIIEECKKSGKSIASQLHRLKNSKVTTFVSEGDGVIEQSNRTKRSNAKRKK